MKMLYDCTWSYSVFQEHSKAASAMLCKEYALNLFLTEAMSNTEQIELNRNLDIERA